MKLHASGEDYLEAILVLHKKMGMVRSVDVARHPRRQNLLFAVFEGRNVLRGGIKHFYELKHPPDAFLA